MEGYSDWEERKGERDDSNRLGLMFYMEMLEFWVILCLLHNRVTSYLKGFLALIPGILCF